MQCILAINSSTDYNAKIFDPRKRTHTIFSWLYICICQFFLKSNRKDAFTALIMMLSQVQATMPAHDQLWIKCHTMHYPRRFVICVYRTQKKTHIDPQRFVCVLVLSEKHTQWTIWSICGPLGHSVNDRKLSQRSFLFLGFYEWYCWCDSHLGGTWYLEIRPWPGKLTNIWIPCFDRQTLFLALMLFSPSRRAGCPGMKCKQA